MNDERQMNSTDRIPGGVDFFDFMLATARDNPESTQTRTATLRTAVPILGAVETFTVQTFRIPDGPNAGDWGFVERINAQSVARVVLPPAVTAALARQRDTLTATGRSKRGKAAAQARKDAGGPNPLNDPEVRAKALAARKRKALKRKAARKG